MTDLEILDKWFLKNENCTYKEFCNIYNDGRDLKGNLPFVNFPKEILQIIRSKIESPFLEVLPGKFVDFLEREGALEEYLKEIERNFNNTNDFLTDINVNRNNIIDRSFSWSRTDMGFDYWSELNNKYQRL